MNWQLNKIQYPVYNLGPGKRIGIWVQGCSLHCDGCINSETWNRDGGKAVDILELFHFCSAFVDDYNGITITGGEPFEQYAQLVAFSLLVKRKTKFNLMVYSGYSLDELQTQYPDKAFYRCIDYLIAGRFEKNNLSDLSIKGSKNQIIWTFKEGSAAMSDLCNGGKKWSIICGDDIIYMAGIPVNGEWKDICKFNS